MNEGAEPPLHSAPATAKPARKRRVLGCAAIALGLLTVLGIAIFLAGSFIVSAVRGGKALRSANKLVWSRQYEEALPLYTAALREYLPKNDRALAYGNRGWAYLSLERDLDAINDFNSALAIDPNLGFALLDRGLAFHRRGEFDQAQADYDKVIALDPNSLDAYRNRSLILAIWVVCQRPSPTWMKRSDAIPPTRGGLADAGIIACAPAILKRLWPVTNLPSGSTRKTKRRIGGARFSSLGGMRVNAASRK
ncbi:MAG: tetratricopeptide repeat protein [Chthoniobacterales bacterium]